MRVFKSIFVFIVICSMFNFSGCKITDRNAAKQFIETKLDERYGEKFTVTSLTTDRTSAFAPIDRCPW